MVWNRFQFTYGRFRRQCHYIRVRRWFCDFELKIVPQLTLNNNQVSFLVVTKQKKRNSFPTGPPSPTRSVYISVGVCRRAKLENKVNIFNINAEVARKGISKRFSYQIAVETGAVYTYPLAATSVATSTLNDPCRNRSRVSSLCR